MSWGRRFRLREQVRGSLWIVPLVGAVLGSILGAAVAELDRHLDLPNYFQYSSSTASTVLTAIVGAAAALTGFVVTVTTLMVQMVNGTFSPRYMRLWYRDPLLKATLALLAGHADVLPLHAPADRAGFCAQRGRQRFRSPHGRGRDHVSVLL